MKFATELESHSGTALKLECGREISYHELARAADKFAEPISDSRLVAIECDNQLESLAAYLGAFRRAIPVLLLDASTPPSMRASIYERYHISRIFSNKNWQDQGGCSPEVHPDTALLLSTSGSTGSPKLVRLSKQNIAANTRQIIDYLRLESNSVAITNLPMHYAFGLSVIHTHLAVGSTLALTNRGVTDSEFWRHFRSAGVTHLSGVPATFQMLRRLRLEQMNLPSLRTLMQAGGRLQTDDVQHITNLCERQGWQFFVMYGQSEATARISYLPLEYLNSHPSSVGVPVSEGRFEIVNTSSAIIDQPGEVGELVYYGPNVMMGYANSIEDLALGDVMQGCLPTGDLASLDEEGLCSIRGRKARFIKMFGSRISLDEVEAVLQERGLSVAVLGHDDLLTLAGTSEATLAAGMEMVVQTFGFRRANITSRVVSQIPVSSSGKIQYGTLADLTSGSSDGSLEQDAGVELPQGGTSH